MTFADGEPWDSEPALFLIALGAILRFAVTEPVRGVDLEAVGAVLRFVGAILLIRGSGRMDDPYEPPRYRAAGDGSST